MMTSAPNSARMVAATGPASHWERSRTRIPASGPNPTAAPAGERAAIASTRGRAAMAPSPARTASVCSPSRGAASGFRAGVRDSFGTGAGAMNSMPVSDESDRRSPRARTCSSAMISSTERIAVPVTPQAKKRASTSARSCRAIQVATSALDVGAVLEPRGGRGEPRILGRIGRLDRLAESHERLVAGAGYRDPSAVAGRVDIGGHDGG